MSALTVPQVKLPPKAGRKGVRKAEDMTPTQRTALATPEGFGRAFLGLPMYPPQRAVLRDVAAEGAKVVFRCGNEVGKTSVVLATAILWHLTVFPTGQVISTAGAWRQVTQQLVPNLKKHSHKFPAARWQFNSESIVVDGVPRYCGFSTTNQQRSQGYHGDSLNPLMAAIDEAASVADDIFFSFEERVNPQRLLVLGSPLDPQGMFYRNATELGKFYQQHKLSQPECPHIERAAIFRTLEKYDPAALESVDRDKPDWAAIEARCKHPVVLSRVFGAFYRDMEGGILSLRDLELCLENPPVARPGDRKVFCDFAMGGDENVVAARVGNRLWIEKAWRDKDTMSGVGEFVRLFKKLEREHGFRAEDIEGDADGAGKVMIDRLHELGWPIEEFHGGGKPRLDGRYFNLISEVWIEGADLIRKRQVVLERDPDLLAQLVGRKWHRKSDGAARIEPKEDLFKRGLPSPDRADALLGAMQPGRLVRSQNLFEQAKAANPTKDNPFEGESVPAGFGVDEGVLEHLGGALG